MMSDNEIFNFQLVSGSGGDEREEEKQGKLSIMELLNTKWMATVFSIWILSSCGCYTFSVYSSVLKSSQGYDQSTLNTVAFFSDVGGSFGVLAGLLYSFVTPEHGSRRPKLGIFVGGPWVVLFAGAVQGFTGFSLMWACVIGLIPPPPVPVMCLLMSLAYSSISFSNTANIVTGVHNFRDYSGTIIGIIKGFTGLSGAIMIRFYQTLFKDDPSTFILILALMPTIVTFLFMSLVRNYDTSTKSDKKYLEAFGAVAMIIAFYIVVIQILENMIVFPSWVRNFTSTVLLLLLISPLRIAIKAQREGRECDGGNKSKPDYKYNPSSALEKAEEDPSDYQELPGGEESQARVASSVEFEQYHTDLRGSLCSINFCLLFGSMLFGFGSGVATTNNIGQIGQSLGYTSTEINSMVSLFSVWNFLGRMASGYVSDIFLHRYRCGRPLFIATTLSAMAIGNLIIAFGFPKSLYIGLLLVGLSFGSQLSLIAAVTSEIFSLAHFGTVFNIIGIAAPVGSYIFSVRVMGYFYDIAAIRNDDGNNTCFGTHCFMPSLIIMAAVAVVGILFALALFFRTRKFYQEVVFRQLHYT